MDELQKLRVTTAVGLLIASVDHAGQPRMDPDEVSDLAAVTIGRAMSGEAGQLCEAAASGNPEAIAIAQGHLEAIRKKIAKSQKQEA